MPNYTTIQQKLDSANSAAGLQEQLKGIYSQCKVTQGLITLYTSGTDPDFNAAIDSIFTAPERTELNQMLVQVEALIADWEANHSVLLGIV